MWCCTESVVDSDNVRDSRRPRVPFESSFRSFEGFRVSRWDKGILLSLELRSLSGVGMLSLSRGADCIRPLGIGMREDTRLVDVMLPVDRDGSESVGDPVEGGCEIQSSDKESSQAFSIAPNQFHWSRTIT